jgi:anti-anti-sigma factor
MMNTSIREVDGIQVIEFEGNLDTSTAPDAENTVHDLLASGTDKLLINFENLNYISSAGLRVLLTTAKKMRASGGSLKICSLNATVREVFDISGFSTILSVTESEQEAIAAF